MKTLRLVISIIVVAVISCNVISWGQPIQSDIIVTFTDYDYTAVAPGLGIVNGTYTYHFSYKLSKEGFIEAIHWNVTDFNITNQDGEKVKVVDSGHDTNGWLWAWFNIPNSLNEFNPGLTYSCTDGWLNELMPSPMPAEGVAVEMSCKVFCKGEMFRIPFLGILHINANGVETVNVIKP